ncbi:MAG: phosphoglyceromutase [Gammaproteobacteria bacterium]|nr:phosphoglyceromutase [Gammaproteobacteria bacterium]
MTRQTIHDQDRSVILIRHAQSQWNRENRFTGWANPPLTAAGVAEAERAGDWLRIHGYRFDAAYSSRLERAIATLDILLARLGQDSLPRMQDWRLNERHYGALQGLDKAQATARVGEHQVWRWRRGYTDTAAPLLRSDPAHPASDPLYADVDPQRLPGVESLAQTRERVAGFWREQVIPRIRRGERILISAHGNTLRALIMELAGMSVEEVEQFEIPTATPILYRFTPDGRPLDWRYLGCDPGAARSA